MRPNFTLFDHTADLGIRVVAPTMPQLIPPAVQGLYAAIGELAPSGPGEPRTWDLAGDDPAGLLRDFLTELLFAFETDHCMAIDPQVREFTDRRLRVEALVAPLDAERSILFREVKAITYHELAIRPIAGGYEATIIVDI